MRNNEQDRMPILEMLQLFSNKNEGYFNIPSHHFGTAADRELVQLFGDKVFRYDLTETDGTDDLHAAEGPILEAEHLASKLFGSDECHLLVNGSSCGIEAMIFAAVYEGEKILLPRNAHRSVFSALVMSGAIPVWVDPIYDQALQCYGALSADSVEQQLYNDPDIKAVLCVSPTYHGIASPLKTIAKICHKYEAMLLVDEAHGTHFHFSQCLPANAKEAGADLFVQSLHKTGGSLTQTSLLHRIGDRVDRIRLRMALHCFQSTSPSYLLMASLDAARHRLAIDGENDIENLIAMAKQLRVQLSAIPGIRTVQTDDLCRVIFGSKDANISGWNLQEALFQEQITTEMADARNVIAILSPGMKTEECDALVEATEHAIKACEMKAKAVENRIKDEKSAKATERAIKACEAPHSGIPVQCMTPREAMQRANEVIPTESAVGRISAEAISVYPPGIPMIYPGERIESEHVAMLQSQSGLHFQGLENGSCKTLRVLKEQPFEGAFRD